MATRRQQLTTQLRRALGKLTDPDADGYTDVAFEIGDTEFDFTPENLEEEGHEV